MAERSKLVVISGPSGAGKTTVCDRLLEEPTIVRAITATTRPPLDDEVEGVHYYFLDEETFRDDIEAGRFLEWAEVYGRLYGTPEGPLEAQLSTGKTVLLNIDVQGAGLLMERSLPALFVFIEPPDLEELRHRLEERGLDDAQSIETRMKNARSELERKDQYDHCVVNNDLDRAVEQVLEKIRTARVSNTK